MIRRQITRSVLIGVLGLLALATGACAGAEDGFVPRDAGATPRVVENATPVQLGRPQDPAAIAATAAAEVSRPSQPALSQPTTVAQSPAAPKAGAPPVAAPPKSEAKPAPQTETQPGIRVGIVQPTWETLRLREQDLGAQVRLVDSADMDEYQRSIDQLIRGGTNVVITVGVDLVQVTQDAAERNPNVKFVGVDQYQDRVLPNVIGLVWEDDKAGFIAGALAGLMTKTNKVGAVVGPGWMPTMVNLGEGFAAGAEYVNPNVEAWIEYHSGELPQGLHDQEWGRESALLMVEDGADVIFAGGGRTGQAALEAARSKNVLAIGSEVDQYEVVPSVRPVLLTSIVKVLSTQTVQQLVQGFTGGSIRGGNVFGDIAIAPLREAEAKIPKSVWDRVQTIERGLKQGSIKTGIQAH